MGVMTNVWARKSTAALQYEAAGADSMDNRPPPLRRTLSALNLVALPAVIACGRLRALSWVNAIFVAILLAISLIFRFPPPAVFALVAEVCFVWAALRARAPMPAESF